PARFSVLWNCGQSTELGLGDGLGDGDGLGEGVGVGVGLGDGDGEEPGRSVMISDPARPFAPAVASSEPVGSVFGGTKSAAMSVPFDGGFGSWMLNRFVIWLGGVIEVVANVV